MLFRSDILKELGGLKGRRVLVGFAAETHDHAKHGLEKLRVKNLDMIVVNPVGGPDSGFDSDTNQATIFDSTGKSEEVPLISKRALADLVLDRVVSLLSKPSR